MNQLVANYAPKESLQEDKNLLFPIFLKTSHLKLLIVGGGNVGFEKLNAILLNNSSTSIKVVAIFIQQKIKDVAADYPNIVLEERDFHYEDLEDIDWVIIAIDDKELSAEIRAMAKSKNLLTNVADTPDLCDFYLGSIVQKGHLKIAISTNGKSPTIAKRLKEFLNENLPDELDQSLKNMEQLRSQLKGDFAYKVKYLNRVTKGLLKKDKTKKLNWKLVQWVILFICLVALFILYYFRPENVQSIVPLFISFLKGIDDTFYIMMITGFFAQMIDGLLGMGYGVTCTTVLLNSGISLPAISSSIHTAEIFSTGASGLSHYKFGNINKKLFFVLVIPGIAGAVVGAFLLSYLGNEYAKLIKPILALYTLILGLRILNYAFKKSKINRKVKRVGWLAACGGFLDSFGGGGWGPLVSSTLISKGKTPRFVIGTVSLTEFFVTFSSAITFFATVGIGHWYIISGLVIGGVLAAPLAAKLAGKLPRKAMFFATGSMVVFWSLYNLIRVFQ
jgi:uncharacterized protein